MTTLSGRWLISAVAKEAGWDQGMLVAGSDHADGLHVMNVGDSFDLTGDDTTLTLQYHNADTDEWHDSLMKDQFTWSDQQGMTVTISGDDNPPIGDLDFNDLVVVGVALDPELASPHAGLPRPELTVPEGKVRWE
jgi:hypothetical protein